MLAGLLTGLSVLGALGVAVPPAGAAVAPLTRVTTTATDALPVQLALGDFDEDGDLDAAVANLFGRSVGILRNGGTGTFTHTRSGPHTSLLFVPSGTPSITGLDVGDFDLDGHLDLVFATFSGEYLGFLFGNGDGTFAPMSPVNIVPGGQSWPDEVAVGDVNRDGRPDVVFTRSLDSKVDVLLGTGTRTFTRTTPTTLTSSGPNGLELGDLDGDGDLDAVVVFGGGTHGAPGRASVLVNDGGGRFAVGANHEVVGTNGNNPSPHDNPLAIGDIDGDGDHDVLVPGNHSTVLNVLTNDGAGRLTGSTRNVFTTPWGVAIEDLDGDGIVDIVLGGRISSRVLVLTGTGGGAFAGTPAFYSAGDHVMGVATGDFDGDRRPDVLATVPFSNQVAFLRNTMAPPPNAAPTPGPGGPYTAVEGQAVSLTGTATDPERDPVSTQWSASGTGVDPGAGCTFGDAASLATTVTCTDDGSWTLTLSASDGRHPAVLATTSLTVANALPAATLSSPAAGALHRLGEPVSVTVDLADAGSNDSHTCELTWDDGTAPSAGTVTDVAGARSCTATHTYGAAGVNTVSATVTDDDGGSSAAASTMVVTYDPSAGFVTGGGWIDSPPGAYVADPSLGGKATFGFVSRYQKGASTPSGQTEFQFRAGDLTFASTSYDWLVVSGPLAQYKGAGTVGGVPGFTFLLTARDGGAPGGGGVDQLRMKIRDGAGGIVYDNAIGASDGIDQARPQAIGGGSIVIHTR